MSNSEEELQFGKLNERKTLSYVPLDWHAKALVTDAEGRVEATAVRELQGLACDGLYVVEGVHDAHPTGCILYIGESGNDGKGSRLGQRIVESLGLTTSAMEKLANRGRIWSTFSNVTVRWAAISETNLIGLVESLLIQAHAPPLNSKEIRGFYKGEPGLVVLNAGAKGRLMPCVASDYYRKEPWPEGTA